MTEIGEEEVVPLRGGRITSGVVQIGNTVRRPASASSPFVASLLDLLESRGFTGAPRYLGPDQAGRDSFSFLPGWVPPKFQTWADAQVAAAGTLARAMHDATRNSDLAGKHQIVCHHDLGPNNTVFQDAMPVAFIDFDMSAPGSPLEDVGYMAWVWCVSARAEAPPAQFQAQQVRVLADAYGLAGPERTVLVDAMLERQTRNARFWAELMASPESAPAEPDMMASRREWSRREFAFTVAIRSVIEDALA